MPTPAALCDRLPRPSKRSAATVIAALGLAASGIAAAEALPGSLGSARAAVHLAADQIGAGAAGGASTAANGGCNPHVKLQGFDIGVCVHPGATPGTVAPDVYVNQAPFNPLGLFGSCSITLSVWDDAGHELTDPAHPTTVDCSTNPPHKDPHLTISPGAPANPHAQVNVHPDGHALVHAFAQLNTNNPARIGDSPALDVFTGGITLPQQPAQPTVADGSNDYPWDGLTAYRDANGDKLRYDKSSGRHGDQWGMGYGQCVSFVAWKIYESHGGTQRPTQVPATGGWFPSDGLKLSPVRAWWKNAGEWNTTAAQAGFKVDHTPHVGAVAQWVTGGDNGYFPVGHVAYVTKVYPDGSIDIVGYNLRDDTGYSTLHLTPQQGGTDTAADHLSDPNDAYHTSSFVPFPVTWPDNFIHIYDGS